MQGQHTSVAPSTLMPQDWRDWNGIVPSCFWYTHTPSHTTHITHILTQLTATEAMNYDDAFTLEEVTEELVDKFNHVAGIVPILTAHIRKVRTCHMTCDRYCHVICDDAV